MEDVKKILDILRKAFAEAFGISVDKICGPFCLGREIRMFTKDVDCRCVLEGKGMTIYVHQNF